MDKLLVLQMSYYST